MGDNMKFSPSKNSFFDPSYTSVFPSDAVDVPDTTYTACIAALKAGGKYQWDATTLQPIAVAAPVPPPPTLAQQAAALLAGTVTVSSTSTASLNGTYTITAQDQAHINAVVTGILLNGSFPEGATTYTWPDSSGANHTFPSTTEFKAFATAILNFVSACFAVIKGVSTTLPNNQLSIP